MNIFFEIFHFPPFSPVFVFVFWELSVQISGSLFEWAILNFYYLFLRCGVCVCVLDTSFMSDVKLAKIVSHIVDILFNKLITYLALLKFFNFMESCLSTVSHNSQVNGVLHRMLFPKKGSNQRQPSKPPCYDIYEPQNKQYGAWTLREQLWLHIPGSWILGGCELPDMGAGDLI